MFYCKDCQKMNNWPESWCRSYGQCEICKKAADCNDVPSSCLPVTPLSSPEE